MDKEMRTKMLKSALGTVDHIIRTNKTQNALLAGTKRQLVSLAKQSPKSCSNCASEDPDCPSKGEGITVCQGWMPKHTASLEQLRSMSEHNRQHHSPSDKPTPSPEPAKPTVEPKKTCGNCAKSCKADPHAVNACPDWKTVEPPKLKGHAPDCEFQLDIGGSPCTCGYRTAPKPETFLKPTKGKCTLCLGHAAMMDSCTRCGGTGKEPVTLYQLQSEPEENVWDEAKRGVCPICKKPTSAFLEGVCEACYNSDDMLHQLIQRIQDNDRLEAEVDRLAQFELASEKYRESRKKWVAELAAAKDAILRLEAAFVYTEKTNNLSVKDLREFLETLKGDVK